jgi:hypothetical protein
MLRALNLALAASWLLVLVGVGIRSDRLAVASLWAGAMVFGCWCVMLARGRPP